MNGISGFDIALRLIRLLVARKRIILLGTFVPTLIAVISVFLMTSYYRSEALVNPPMKENGSLAGIENLAGGMGGVFSSLLGNESGLNDCLKIMGSARYAEIVIARFDLETAYGFKRPGKKPKKYYRADVIKAFRKKISFEDTKEGGLKISVRDTSAVRARDIASYMIVLLDSLYTDIQRTAARRSLEYVDRRLSLAEAEAGVLEDSMVAFQKRHNIVVPEAQVRLALQNAAQTEIRKEVLEEEMALEATMRGTSSAKYKDLVLQKQLLERSFRKRVDGNQDALTLLPSTQNLPSLAAEYFRLERSYAIRTAVYKFLVQQVEMLKLDAEKNIQVISVIDPPWANEKRISPRRRIVVETVFIFSFVLCVVGVALWEAWTRYRKANPDAINVVNEIRTGLTKF